MFFDLLPEFLVAINIISIFICIYDKHQAKRRKFRVPEGFLMTLSIIGGALGMYICMLIIRHKTKNIKFSVGLPLIILFQIITVFCLKKYIV